MSLVKIKTWLEKEGRYDLTQGRSARELEVLDRFCRIALDLADVVPHQGARAGKGGEQHDLNFGRRLKDRKTPVLFAGIAFRPQGGPWLRRNDIVTPDAVRIYLKITVSGSQASPWKDWVKDDDGLKPEPEWRYVEIPPEVSLEGDEMLNLVEDAYFEASGI